MARSSTKPRPIKYKKTELSCKYTPTQVKRIIAASTKEYSALAHKYKMPIRTAFFFRQQQQLSVTSAAEKKKLVNRLFDEGVRFCLERKRSYKNLASNRPTKTVRYEEILDFMKTNCGHYHVEVNWIPKERTLRGMISADKKRRQPTGHRRQVERLKNRQISAEQFKLLRFACNHN
ncbi:MAG: hypothetical protein KGL63_07515 [Betaproteobacteria bacterium]|nr:hypothetical protein [Betaproteobacteria bacterium]